MPETEANKPWGLRVLGERSDKERAAFYEGLIADIPTSHMFGLGGGDARLFENPSLEVGVIMDDGRVVSAEQYPRGTGLQATRVDVYLERYFVQSMPGKSFDLQLAVSSRHEFDDRAEAECVSHTLVVQGVPGHYANYLGEPVFRGLKIGDSLTLDVAVTFLTDRSTERLVGFLKAPELQKGIQLIAGYNPVFGTVATLVRGVVESLAGFKKNMAITNAHMTFQAKPGALSLPLIEGSYVFFQPSTETDESFARKPRYDSGKQRIVYEGGDPFERNHMILRVRQHP